MSKSPRGGLGRGIESLIRTSAQVPRPTESAPESDAVVKTSPANGNGAAPVRLVEGGIAPAPPPAEDGLPNAEPSPLSPGTPPAPESSALQPRAGKGRSPLDVFWGPHPGRPLAAVPDEPDLPALTDLADTSHDIRPEFRELAVDEIHANARQPRSVFDEESLAELAHSVRAFGVLQPVVVRPDPAKPGSYELVMGERRLRAARAAGLKTIPAVVRHTADDAMLRDALLENLHRAQLNPLEEAAAYQQLLEEFGVTHDELATRIGRSRSQVSNTVRLMNLSLPVQRRVAAGVLSAGHARALLALTDSDAQDDLAARIVAEGLSVRATEELVSLTAKGLVGATRRRPARHFVAPAATDLAERLSDRFDTTVRVEIGRRKGKVTIEFATVDDLERIVEVMAPGLASVRAGVGAGAGTDTPSGVGAGAREGDWTTT